MCEPDSNNQQQEEMDLELTAAYEAMLMDLDIESLRERYRKANEAMQSLINDMSKALNCSSDFHNEFDFSEELKKEFKGWDDD